MKQNGTSLLYQVYCKDEERVDCVEDNLTKIIQQ